LIELEDSFEVFIGKNIQNLYKWRMGTIPKKMQQTRRTNKDLNWIRAIGTGKSMSWQDLKEEMDAKRKKIDDDEKHKN